MLIPTATYLQRVDREASQWNLLEQINSNALTTDVSYMRITVLDDYQIEESFIYDAHRLDQYDFADNNTSYFAPSIAADETHFKIFGYANTDAYLSGNAIQVSPQYDDIYFAVKGVHLNAIDVFAPVFEVAQFTQAGGFESVSQVGTGIGKRSDVSFGDGALNNYAVSQFSFIVSGNPIGADEVTLQFYGIKSDTSIGSETINIPAYSEIGYSVESVGSYYDFLSGITEIDINAGDKIDIQTVLQRTIEL
jgi:hypothetical protein